MISVFRGTWHLKVFRAWGLVTINSSRDLVLNDLKARQWQAEPLGTGCLVF